MQRVASAVIAIVVLEYSADVVQTDPGHRHSGFIRCDVECPNATAKGVDVRHPRQGAQSGADDPVEQGTALLKGEVVALDGEHEDFEFSGRNYIVWDRMSRLGGDDAIALVDSDGNIIDQIGDDEDPGSGWPVAGISVATRNHTLIRKSNIISGNTNWEESAGTNAEDSEWQVYDQDTFEDIFEHSCFPE